MQDICSVAPTICEAMGVPFSGSTPAFSNVLRKVAAHSIERCLIYAPDALGTHVYKEMPDYFLPLERRADVVIDTWAGVPHDKKIVLNCQTMFDDLLKAGKKVAIATTEGSSIDILFRDRKIDYFSEVDDQAVTHRTLALLEMNHHDVILAYHQEYDDCFHRHGPFSLAALQAVKNHMASFQELAGAFDFYWREHERMLAVTPDHGGLEMELKHFFVFGHATNGQIHPLL